MIDDWAYAFLNKIESRKKWDGPVKVCYAALKHCKMSTMRASREPSKLPKSQSFRGLCPLDPRRGFAPGPHQGPLSGPLDPTPLYAPRLCSLRLNWSIYFLALLSDQCFWRGYAPGSQIVSSKSNLWYHSKVFPTCITTDNSKLIIFFLWNLNIWKIAEIADQRFHVLLTKQVYTTMYTQI